MPPFLDFLQGTCIVLVLLALGYLAMHGLWDEANQLARMVPP